MMRSDSMKRYSASKCLNHELFDNISKKDLSDLPKLKLEIDKPEFACKRIFKNEEKYAPILFEMLK